MRTIAHKALMADPEFADTPFDYTASLAKRTQQINTAKAAWLKGRPHGIAQQLELLLDDQGKPLKDAADRLTDQRNNRPMTLQE